MKLLQFHNSAETQLFFFFFFFFFFFLLLFCFVGLFVFGLFICLVVCFYMNIIFTCNIKFDTYQKRICGLQKFFQVAFGISIVSVGLKKADNYLKSR